MKIASQTVFSGPNNTVQHTFFTRADPRTHGLRAKYTISPSHTVLATLENTVSDSGFRASPSSINGHQAFQSVHSRP
jgi:hypothetical protein